MRVAVISCWKYRDAWGPMFSLMDKLWWGHPDIDLATDAVEESPHHGIRRIYWLDKVGGRRRWCEVLAGYAKTVREPILLMQEDFFLNAPVRQDLVNHALQQMQSRNAGMIRLYPCPGADDDYGDPHVGIVRKGSAYRVSCQASIFRPDFLHAIASQCGDTPRDFEINGTRIAESMPEEVLAWKRESEPWPMSYYCSAISRGKWEPAALEFCRQQGIAVDTSMRPVA